LSERCLVDAGIQVAAAQAFASQLRSGKPIAVDLKSCGCGGNCEAPAWLLHRLSLYYSSETKTITVRGDIPDLIDIRDDDSRASEWDELIRRVVKPAPYVALQALKEFARKRKGVLSFPSFETLARRMRCNRRTAIRRVESLENAGVVFAYKIQAAVNAYAFAFPPTPDRGESMLASVLFTPRDRVFVMGPPLRLQVLRPGERLLTHRV
jgi:hypothetical protein